MIRLLSEILRFRASRELLLLSSEGDILYRKVRWHLTDSDTQSRVWKGLVAGLKYPQAARFHFDQGLYYLHHAGIGYVVVGLEDDRDLGSIETLCQEIKVQAGEGRIRRDFFLRILDEVDFRLKPQVVDELAPLSDRVVADRLIILLDRYLYFPDDIRNSLLESICRSLGSSSSRKSLTALNRFLHHYTEGGRIDEHVDRAARVSIRQLEFEFEPGGEVDILSRPGVHQDIGDNGQSPGRRQGVSPGGAGKPQPKERRSAGEEKTGPASQALAGGRRTAKSSGEEKLRQLLAEGRKEEAVAMLMKYIQAAAKQKLFDKAEKLREKLIQIDSMMLTEIIQAAEIIEAEKAASIRADHLSTWKSLADMLNQEEFAALYHSMILQKSSNGETLFSQGDFRPQLIFVNSGKLKVYANAVDKETYLKTVDEGEVLGAETFFEPSVWTYNVQSNGAELFCLERKNLDQLVWKYPAIESKLIDFCALFVSPDQLFVKTGRSRRTSERKAISGRVAFSLIDGNGRESREKLKGDLFDLSTGGVSFCLRISKKSGASKLFGRQIRLGLPTVADGKVGEEARSGKVVAIKGHHVVGNEYSVHVEFTAPLTRKELQNAAQMLNIV